MLDVYTIHQKKVALSNFDDKRYILDDGYTTLAHGYYIIRGDIRQDPLLVYQNNKLLSERKVD